MKLKKKARDHAVELVEKHQSNFDGLALEIEELEKEAKSTTEEIEAASGKILKFVRKNFRAPKTNKNL